MKYPTYVIVENVKYYINTDFRVAIKCNSIAEDTNIGDLERSLAIICTLYGEKGLDNPNHYEKLLELAKKYLSCGKEIEVNENEKPDMDFVQDMDYIEASFMSDYNIDLSNINMHWWKFFKLMNGLSNSDFGNCCVLNRVRNLRTYDTKDIKDVKERKKIEDAKRKVALKKNKKDATDEQLKSASDFLDALGIGKE